MTTPRSTASGNLDSALTGLAATWRVRAAELRSWGASGNAETLERAAAELERKLAESDEQRLSLEEAASQSGYSADHLRRLARTGQLQHEREGRRLYFRAGDLPRRTPHVDAPQVPRYDPVADARKVAGLRAHGGR